MENISLELKPARTFGGAKVPHRKHAKNAATIVMPPPKTVEISMQQHIGAPCTPLVKVGDTVKAYQKIGESEAFVSAPIHASISGTVKKIGSLLLPNGQKIPSVIIESDGELLTLEGIAPPQVTNAEELAAAARASGLVGLGGAGFPAHVKLIPGDKKIDTLVINGAECEPYITADYREMIEHTDDILNGIFKIKDILKISCVKICIEDNKPEAINILEQRIKSDSRSKGDVFIVKLKSRYPQGAEKVLVQAATGRLIPAGGLPAHVGCILMNVTSVAFLARYLRSGLPLVSKRLTFAGSAAANPCNVEVRVGTSIKDIAEFCGGFKGEPKKILLGGPMMGTAIYDVNYPITKKDNAILVFNKRDAKARPITSCIRCGRCLKVCPMKLRPCQIEQAAELQNAEALDMLDAAACMECGSCAYVCPAGRKLVQSIKLGKQILREGK
ncbi:MAG: electron transport complex subunit RsxC [Oscillospiraceae bacterium]|nr:electron transport complex subunit RsxC [Oscillospiraceae bacterium]